MIEQRTEQWRQQRLGIPTASSFHRIVTGTGKVASATVRRGYMTELLAERLNVIEAWNGNHSTDRGTELEVRAVSAYELITDLKTAEVGFVPSDCGRYGCSPDRLIKDFGASSDLNKRKQGGLEMKCCEGKKHIDTVLNDKIPSEHLSQVYGCMYLCGAQWWDFMAFHPSLKPLIVRVTDSDKEYRSWLEVFKEQIVKFCDALDKAEQELTDVVSG